MPQQGICPAVKSKGKIRYKGKSPIFYLDNRLIVKENAFDNLFESENVTYVTLRKIFFLNSSLIFFSSG